MCATALLCAGLMRPASLEAQGAPGSGAAPAGARAPRAQPSFSWRTRAESWRWFDAPDADARYAFVGTLVRAGIAGTAAPRVRWMLEGAVPALLGLPGDAIGGAPRGQLGFGAAYFAANGREQHVVRAFVKQAWMRVGHAPVRGGHAARLGRFEWSEGTELVPANATLATLKRDRVTQRLVGPFSWTHVGRALDGVHYTYDRGARPGRGPYNVTVVAALPTEGAFRASAWEPLRAPVAYAAYTRGFGGAGRGAASDLRLFALHYEDRRDPARAVRVDNRPAPARLADRERIRLTTLGAHLLHVVPTAAGPLDLLAWGTVQTGTWGALDHRASAAALEAGWQPAGVPWRPWLRALWYRGSGDRDAADGRHGTFFQVLPTPRVHARFPMHNLMNLEQAGASLVLRPHARLTFRSDAQALRLAVPADLWYAGGGAFERGSFGYAGRPGGGGRRLASLADLSADVRLTRRVGVNGYVARAGARDVARAVYPGTGPAYFGYVELDVRY